jgi:hypothetical protein
VKIGAIGSHPVAKRATDLVVKFLPVAGLALLGAFIAAQQAVSPQHRVIKAGVFVALMTLMLRFDMVYSVYLFAVLFNFPSSVSIGSTNCILMTLIPLIWVVRATSTKAKLYVRKTRADFAIVLYLFAYALSFINVQTTGELMNSLKVMWVTATSVVFFYTIVTFVNDERKIITLVKISCGVCGFAMLAALLELFMPGRALIPGWMGFVSRPGMGELGYRVQGMRVGSVFGSHDITSDVGARSLFLLAFLVARVRNPFEKVIWGGVMLLTIVGVLATANRGGFFSFVLGVFVCLYLFRKQIPVMRIAVLVGALAALFAVSELVLTKYTNATSLTARIVNTQFYGVVPDTRKHVWIPALMRCFEHPFVGHGPYYDLGEGLSYKNWPHNGLIFLFHTVGIFGVLAFLAVLYRVWRYALSYRLPRVRGSTLADLSKVLYVVLLVMMAQLMRTDFQREDVYPYMVWMVFGLITATAQALQGMSESAVTERLEDQASGGNKGRRHRRLGRPRHARFGS